MSSGIGQLGVASWTSRRASRAWRVWRWLGLAALAAQTACAGGTPLLHPAQTLAQGDIRLAGGISANIATGEVSDDLRRARDIAAQPAAAAATGPAGSVSTDYAKGALVAASVAPGIAPFVGGRIGIGHSFEGGLTYTGRAVRVDGRRAFERGPWALSVGLGASAAFYGQQQGGDLPGVDLAALRGYGADIPVLVGWHSENDLYMFWVGPRVGGERDTIAPRTSEPSNTVPGAGPLHLEATRLYGGGVLGVATGFSHVHVAFELDVTYQYVTGTFNGTDTHLSGVTFVPASALLFDF